MTGYSTNFWKFWDNGRNFTANSEGVKFTLGYAENKGLSPNTGFEQFVAGINDPKLSLTGFVDSTNTADYIHHYFGDTYNNETGIADDIDHVLTVPIGYDALPVQGNPVIMMVGTLMSYDAPAGTDGLGKLTAEFGPRGVQGALGVLVATGTSATVTTGDLTAAFDRGTAYATGQSAGGLAMLQWSGSGSSTITADVKTSTTSGGTYATVASLVVTSATKGAAYVVIPPTTTINEFVKVLWTITSSPQTATYEVALAFFNP